jgi:hypothetical protein
VAPEGSLLHSQEFGICPEPESDKPISGILNKILHDSQFKTILQRLVQCWTASGVIQTTEYKTPFSDRQNFLCYKRDIQRFRNTVPVTYTALTVQYKVKPLVVACLSNRLQTISCYGTVQTNSCYATVQTISCYATVQTNSCYGTVQTNSCYGTVQTNNTLIVK